MINSVNDLSAEQLAELNKRLEALKPEGSLNLLSEEVASKATQAFIEELNKAPVVETKVKSTSKEGE